MARSWIIGSGVLLTLALAELASAQPTSRCSRVCPTACTPNVVNYGYYNTTWRQWPGESHLSETNPRAFGAETLPTPEGREQLPVPPSTPNPSSSSPGSGREPLPSPRKTILPPQAPVAVPETPAPPKTPAESGGLPGLPVEPQHAPMSTPFDGGTMPNPAPKSESPRKSPKSRDARYQRPEQSLTASDPSPASQRFDTDARSNPMAHGTVMTLIGTDSASNRAEAAAIATASTGPTDGIEAAGYTTVEQAAQVEITDSGVRVPPIALDGYCPVELIRNGVWKQGDLRWTVVHGGHIYRLSGPAQREAFLANPEAFIPACGGNDSVLAAEQNLQTPGQTAYCALYEGRLYMFSSTATQTQFNRDPTRYTEAK